MRWNRDVWTLRSIESGPGIWFLFICSFNKYFRSIYYTPRTVFHARDSPVTKTGDSGGRPAAWLSWAGGAGPGGGSAEAEGTETTVAGLLPPFPA